MAVLKGIVSRDWLRSVVLNKRILILTVKVKNNFRGKFGRYIAVLYQKKGNECINLNDKLVSRGLAVVRKY